MSQRIGFLGAGQMAQALAAGFLRARIVSPDRIAAFDPAAEAREQFQQAAPGAAVASDPGQLVAGCDTLVLAVKPQVLPQALPEIAPHVDERLLVLSIVAGVSLATLSAALPTPRLIRVMPNTPCLVGAGASGIAAAAGASDADRVWAERLFASVGLAVATTEPQLDAVTGLSGSGPAFVFLMLEALADGGVLAGLPRPIAQQLAAQTVFGAARLAQESGDHPGLLKDRVASPAGTTIAGLQALEERAFRGAVIAAVEAAAERSRELGRPQS